jgi:hypothetical protein
MVALGAALTKHGDMTRYELRILGAPDLRAPDGRRITSVLSQPSRLSLLAYLTLASGPVSRATLVAAFWPESDEARARNALSQAVFYLKRSLGKDVVQSVEGDRLWVPPEQVWCDARELLTGDVPSTEVVAAAGDELLAGWNADGSQPLQEWLDGLRRRVRDRAAALGESGAGDAPARPPTGPAGQLSEPPRAATAGPATPDTRRRPLWIATAFAAGLAALLLFALLPSFGRPPEAAAPTRLAVLLPRVTLSPGAPQLSALTLYGELIARLPERAGLEIVSAAYASSLQDLTRQLAAIGTPGDDMPEWILDVSCIVTGDAVHVYGLLYRGAGFGVPGRDSFDQTFTSSGDMVIDVPRAIAERVVEMVEGAIGG